MLYPPPYPVPNSCGVCGKVQRSLILDTRFGTLTGFCCLGKKDAPPLVVREARDPDLFELNAEDQEFLAEVGVKA
jgi:hypothetical protein